MLLLAAAVRRHRRSNASCTSSATSTSSATAISLVTETIRVEAEGQQISHGICRDFPTTYTRPDGSRVVVGFDVQSVTLDGADEQLQHRADGEWRARAHRPAPTTIAHRRASTITSSAIAPRGRSGFSPITTSLLERDRDRLDLCDRYRGSAHHAARSRAVPRRPRSIPVRRARRGKDARDRRAAARHRSCSAPPGRCRPTMASRSRPPGRRAWSIRRRRRQQTVVAHATTAAAVAGAGLAAVLGVLCVCVAAVSGAIRRAAPSFRCLRRPTACRRRPCAIVEQHGIRRPLLHGRHRRSWRERAHQAHRPAARQTTIVHRHGGKPIGRPKCC